MILPKKQLPILLVNILIIVAFAFLSWRRGDIEFAIYWVVIIFFFFLILLTIKKTKFSSSILWGLTIWAFLHMVGGLITFGEGTVVYKWVIWELVRTPDFVILKYDQFVHAFGFAITTLIGFHIVKPYLNFKKVNWTVLSALLILIGMGFGALNEIIEYIAVVTVPETGVGGYHNTMLDMVFNTIGAVIAVVYLNFRYKK